LKRGLRLSVQLGPGGWIVRWLADGAVAAVDQRQVAQATGGVAQELVELAGAQMEAETKRQDSARGVLMERARIVLAEAAACQAVIADIDDVQNAFEQLRRAGYPWAGLAKLAGAPEMAEVEERKTLFGRDPSRVRARMADLSRSARELLNKLARVPARPVTGVTVSDPRAEVLALPPQP